MEINYKTNEMPTAAAVIAVYESAGLPRPTGDAERIARMYAGSNLVVTAWHGGKLVGVSRAITDNAWVCYLSDLAVMKDYQAYGIGRKLIDLNREALGEEVMLLLLSVPGAMEYYPKIGMQAMTSGFIYPRVR